MRRCKILSLLPMCAAASGAEAVAKKVEEIQGILASVDDKVHSIESGENDTTEEFVRMVDNLSQYYGDSIDISEMMRDIQTLSNQCYMYEPMAEGNPEVVQEHLLFSNTKIARSAQQLSDYVKHLKQYIKRLDLRRGRKSAGDMCEDFINELDRDLRKLEAKTTK